MLERKQKGILSLNLKELASRVNYLNIVLILQNEMLLLMFLCKRVLKQREDIARYGNTINNSFLGTVCSDIFCEKNFHRSCIAVYFMLLSITKYMLQ